MRRKEDDERFVSPVELADDSSELSLRPKRLREILDRPPVLFVRGRIKWEAVW